MVKLRPKICVCNVVGRHQQPRPPDAGLFFSPLYSASLLFRKNSLYYEFCCHMVGNSTMGMLKKYCFYGNNDSFPVWAGPVVSTPAAIFSWFLLLSPAVAQSLSLSSLSIMMVSSLKPSSWERRPHSFCFLIPKADPDV